MIIVAVCYHHLRLTSLGKPPCRLSVPPPPFTPYLRRLLEASQPSQPERMSAVLECFSISEIAHQIFSQCLKTDDGRPLRSSSLLMLGTVCREWLEPTLDTLWETQYSLWPLLKLLPEDCWKIEGNPCLNSHKNFSFIRPPTCEELTTGRVRYYAKRIKAYIDPGEPKIAQETSDSEEPQQAADGIFDYLLHALGNASIGDKPPLLPNLRFLFLTGTSSICQIRLLLGPNVETFHFRHIYFDFETRPPTNGIEDEISQALSRGTSIRSLDIDWAESNASSIVPTVLRQQTDPMISLCLRKPAHLGLLLSLRDWVYAIDSLALSLSVHIPWSIFGLFQANATSTLSPINSIRKLTIHARETLQSPHGFLQAFHPPLLDSLDITFSSFGDIDELQSLMGTLTSPPYRNQLKLLSIAENEDLVYEVETMNIPQYEDSPLLNETDDWYNIYGRDFHDVHPLMFKEESSSVVPIPDSIFAQFMKLSGLQSLSLSLPGLSTLTDEVLSQMAQAWPELEQFIIHGNIFSVEDIVPPKATLQGIAYFGIHCPKLEMLRIAIDTCLPDDTSPPKRQTSQVADDPQLIIHLVDSQPPAEGQLERTAAYLSACFPNIEWIGSNNEEARQTWRRLCSLVKADRLGAYSDK